MRIPKRFKLFGHTIEVIAVPSLAQRQNATGEAHYRFNQILLQPEEGYVGRPATKVEQDFMHEVVHFLLYFGECSDTKELYKNEQVVDRLSMLLHQALTTMEFE